MAPKDRKILALGLSPFLHQGVTIRGSASAEAFLVLGLVFEVFRGDVEVFGAYAEVLALTPDGFHEVADRAVLRNTLRHGYD